MQHIIFHTNERVKTTGGGGGGGKSHCSKEIIYGFKPKKECNVFYLL